jgi:hypothetical protein
MLFLLAVGRKGKGEKKGSMLSADMEVVGDVLPLGAGDQ